MNKLLIFSLFSILIFFQSFAQPTGDEEKYVKLVLKIKHKDNFLLFGSSNNTLDTVISEDNFKLTALTKNFKNKALIDSTTIGMNKNSPYKIRTDKENIIINYKGRFDWIDKYHSDLILSIEKNCRKMKIQFKLYEDCNIDLEIPFKKGVYQVTDPENPELIKIIE